MEFTLTGKECSNAELFSRIGAGNYLHIPLEFYSYNAVSAEKTRQNKYAQCMTMNNKFTVSKKMRKGYITIYQRY